MEIKIINEKKNGLFNRNEVLAEVNSDVAPSRGEVLKILSEKLSVPEENIKILGINGSFGSKTFSVEANIYSSKEDKDSLEIKKKKETEAEKKVLEARQKVEDEAKAAAEAEKAEAEKPVEEIKEEVKEEVTQEETKEEVKEEKKE
jgi:ribosomal protein S24E